MSKHTSSKTSPITQCILSVFAAFCTVFTLSTADFFTAVFRADGLTDLILLVIFCVIYHKSFSFLAKRRAVISACFGAVLALCMSIGKVISSMSPPNTVLLLWPGYWFLFACMCLILIEFLDRYDAFACTPTKKENRFITWVSPYLDGTKKAFFARMLVISAFAGVWLFIFWPGVVNDDVMTQIGMAMDNNIYSAHHPVAHTLFLGSCVKIGVAVFGSESIGVFIASIVQILAQSALFSAVISYLSHLKLSVFWRLSVFLYYAFFPAFSRYASTLVKDVWLAMWVLVFVLIVFDIVKNRTGFFKKPLCVVMLTVSVFGLILAKNTGVYLVVLTALVILVFLKGVRVHALAMLVVAICFNFVLTGPVYSAFGIQGSSVREMLSVPMLQIGRTVLVAGDSIPEEEQLIINEILPYDDLPVLYDYMISDPIKSTMNEEVFLENPSKYIEMWARLGMMYPSSYVWAFLEHTHGYWYPDISGGLYMVWTYDTYTLVDGDVVLFQGVENTPLQQALVDNIGVERNLPGIGLLYNPSFNFWVLAFLCAYIFYKKRYTALIPYSVLFVIWLTCITSPLFGEFRYAYPAIICVPVMLALTLSAPEAQQE